MRISDERNHKLPQDVFTDFIIQLYGKHDNTEWAMDIWAKKKYIYSVDIRVVALMSVLFRSFVLSIRSNVFRCT